MSWALSYGRCRHCSRRVKLKRLASRAFGERERRECLHIKQTGKEIPITCLQRSVVMSSWSVTTLGRGLIGTRSTPGRNQVREFQKAASSKEKGNVECS